MAAFLCLSGCAGAQPAADNPAGDRSVDRPGDPSAVAQNIPVEQAVVSNDRNEVDPGVLLCGMEPDISELMAEAGRRGLRSDNSGALEIYKNVLSIRPNCYDAHFSIAFTYAILKEDRLYRQHYQRGQELQAQWRILNPSNAPPPTVVVQPNPVTREPPPRERINYWKWLFIYSMLRRR